MTSPIGDPVLWRRYWLERLRGLLCFGGMDLGAVNDLSALALFFPKQADMVKAILLLWFWAPSDTDCHTVLKERYGYRDWVAKGFLKLTPGPRTDYPMLREDIKLLNEDYHIEELAFDPRYSFQLAQELEAEGITMVEHSQARQAMTGPIKDFQRQILGRDFAHGANPLLTFMVDNLVVKSDGEGNLKCVKPDNPNSPRKIDGAVASIMAIGRAAANPDATASSGKVFFG